MTDNLTVERRSWNMSRIKSRDTKPELLLRKALFTRGFRYRINKKNLPGQPDIVLKKYKTIIFVHGCFWHGHSNCKRSGIPKSNRDYWVAKINSNIERDKSNEKLLKKEGWNVVKVWECEINTNLEKTLNQIIKTICCHNTTE